jgi:hypothetical protein
MFNDLSGMRSRGACSAKRLKLEFLKCGLLHLKGVSRHVLCEEIETRTYPRKSRRTRMLARTCSAKRLKHGLIGCEIEERDQSRGVCSAKRLKRLILLGITMCVMQSLEAVLQRY